MILEAFTQLLPYPKGTQLHGCLCLKASQSCLPSCAEGLGVTRSKAFPASTRSMGISIPGVKIFHWRAFPFSQNHETAEVWRDLWRSLVLSFWPGIALFFIWRNGVFAHPRRAWSQPVEMGLTHPWAGSLPGWALRASKEALGWAANQNQIALVALFCGRKGTGLCHHHLFLLTARLLYLKDCLPKWGERPKDTGQKWKLGKIPKWLK